MLAKLRPSSSLENVPRAYLTGYRSWDARPAPHFCLALVDGPVVFTSRAESAGLVLGKEGGGEMQGTRLIARAPTRPSFAQVIPCAGGWREEPVP